MTSEAPKSEAVPLTELALVSILKHTFRLFAIDTEMATDEMPRATMRQFVGWCIENGEPLKSKALLVNGASVPPENVDQVHKTINGDPWVCMTLLYPMWPAVVLQARPPLRNAIRFIHIAMTVGYWDEKVVQIQCPIQLQPGTATTDGFLCTLLLAQARGMVDTFSQNGLDKLHEEYGQDPAQTPEDVQRQVMPRPSGDPLGF